MKNKLMVFVLFLPLFFVCQAITKTEVWINVFVHGIVKTPFSINDFQKISHNNVEGSQHYHMVNYLRQRSELYLYQPMQKKGFIEIDHKDSCNGASAIARLYDYQFNSLTSQRFDQHNKKPPVHNIYYTFGWPGYLSRLHREIEAKKLYNILKVEVEKLKAKNIYPKIRIIGFSHAGNLILNMAKDLTYNEKDLPFVIDELVVLAVPVQKETDEYINHPIFKRIYSFYSMGDVAPKADFFSTQFLFSHRRFGRKDLCLPRKLTQVRIRTSNVVFNRCGKIDKQYHVDPNHMEFWNFGWAPKEHRDKFPLKPFSVISLVPFFINAIDSIEDLANDIVLDVIPKLEKIIIKNNVYNMCTPKMEYTLPFISKYDFNEMKKICSGFKSSSQVNKFNKQILTQNAMTYALCKRRHSSCRCCHKCDHLLR